MFDNNTNNAYGGYYWNPNSPQPVNIRMDSTLTREEYDSLMKQGSAFNLNLTDEERKRGICNHMSLDGNQRMLTEEPDGRVRCTVCNYVFSPVLDEMTKEDVSEACQLVIDILQTVKMIYIDLPIATQREFFQIIPLIAKIPQLFEMAVKNYTRHENQNNWQLKGQNMSTMNAFNTLSMIFGGYNTNPYNPQTPVYSFSNQPNPAMQGGMMNNGYNPNGFQGGYAPNPNVNQFNNMPVGSVPPTNGFGYQGTGPMQQPGFNTGAAYMPQNLDYQYNPYQNQSAMSQPYQPQTPPVVPNTTAPTDQQSKTDGTTVTGTATFTS